MLSEALIKLCQSNDSSISAALAGEPTAAPTELWQRLFGQQKAAASGVDPGDSDAALSQERLAQAQKCGHWGPTQPSELFLRAFWSAIRCLDYDIGSGMVSPALMGSYGTLPFTIIAPLADIARHMSNLIARAEKEVILITCVWSPSVAVRLVHNALIELSKRAGEKKQRAVVKIMYDAAGPSHAFKDRQHVKSETYSSESIGLPKPEDIPNLDFEVMSFHKILLGTLHAKFLVVDREIALIMSNNMEDNDNMEMMAQVEGPIVDSIYDTALVTLGDASSAPLPCLSLPAEKASEDFSEISENVYTARGTARELNEVGIDGEEKHSLPSHTDKDPHYDSTLSGEIDRVQAAYATKPNESHLQAINRQLNIAAPNPIPPSGPEIPPGSEFIPYIPISATAPCPIAMVSRAPYGIPSNANLLVPQNAAWLSLISNARHSIFIQTPDLNASMLYSALKEALSRGVEITYYVCLGYNDAGELMPGQGGTNEQFASRLTSSLTPSERERLTIAYYVGKDQASPIHHSRRSRSCHIKLMIVDECVGVQGSGNMDTQSWCHSQEINLMVDSGEVCRKWREGIERNQNTARFGIADKDGIWRDQKGEEAPGAMGNPTKVVGWMKGVVGMVKKARDSGKLHA
ncbi:uncharacterized protein KY384_008096 [Bacidia gigantensis]|uniref:uncharacterized protein n=1 Tax=Bacidia gigantensis TaxID=2732470 RepID=UPI001D053652|nr:uncharacterized protein KY384_008096 [Bacidia gigantensis]KAG8526667.1 hypothetical protein KY384_008096 [Bacidia gigantensis]